MGLEDKLKKLADAKAAEKQIDWTAVRESWLSAIRRLYTDIEGWMQPYVTKRLASTRRVPMEITEDNLGRYRCEALELDFSGEVIRLEPHGTLIIGAFGRVDVVGRSRRLQGETMLIMAGSRESPVWELWPSREPRQLRRFDQAALEAMIEHSVVA